MWDTILEILERKAKEGVEVRFMYDGMCSIALLPYHYPKILEAKGIHCHAFAPIKPALSTYQNNRDHRKIVVIDGHTAFTGGVNLADEYQCERTFRLLEGCCRDDQGRSSKEFHDHVFADVEYLGENAAGL